MEAGNLLLHEWSEPLGRYINADDIKASSLCSDLEAAEKAEALREQAISEKADFTFETVMSTERNLNLLCRAKEAGYFIRGIYVLTANTNVNVARVKVREQFGGHGVPEEKIRSRYQKALGLTPQLVEICDVLHIYDNTEEPFRILQRNTCRKRKQEICHVLEPAKYVMKWETGNLPRT